MIKHSVILLKRDHKRFRNVKNNIQKHIPNLNIFNAFDYKKESIDFFCLENGIKISDRYTSMNAKTGGIANVISHIKLWKKMIKYNIPEMVVLEDDGKINSGHFVNLNNLKKDLPIDLLRKHYNNKTALFNEQVKAPYLLVYKKSLNHFNKNLFKDDHIETGAMGAMVHGYIVSVLANIRDISASFCSCFSSKDSHNYIINNRKDFYFMLGLGYAEKKPENYSRVKKENYLPKLNEVIKWK